MCLVGASQLCVPLRAVGDAIAAGGALGGLLMLLVARLQREEMQLSVFTTVMTATTVAIFLVWSWLADERPPTLTFSPRNGVASCRGRTFASVHLSDCRCRSFAAHSLPAANPIMGGLAERGQ